jgi:hypothetical protein
MHTPDGDLKPHVPQASLWEYLARAEIAPLEKVSNGLFENW